MSSTESPGDGSQQVPPPETAGPDVTTPDAATPDAAPDAAAPDAVAPDAAAPDAVAPDAAAPDAATPDAAPDAVTPAAGTPDAVTADAGTPAAPTPGAAALPDPTDDGAAASAPEAATPAAAPTAPVVHVVSDPARWGRVDEDGTVYVRTADGERAVGSWQAGDPSAGLAHFARRYDDLATEVSLLEARLRAHTGNPSELKAKAQALAETIPTATAVGDLDGLAARARAMVGTADSAAAESRAEKAAARAAQVARKEALAAEAEQIAAESTSWKAAGDRLKSIVEEWKTIRGIDRKTDEALWTRFAAARDAFGRRRGAHFAALDAQRGEARAAKQELIAEAQRLSTSTDWGATSAAMRSLMDRWKAVPRTSRDGDDDLWKQFRAAQDVFFTARSESDKARNSEQLANQQAKEEILAEAEKLDPSGDLRQAQNALRKLQERYDAIGHVPRGAMRSLEDRMQAVEQRVRGASDAGRVRTAPENPMVASMRAAVTKAEEQLAKAEAAGDARRVQEARANLETRREWLAEAEKTASRR
ncbi:hypothetical protein JOD57_001219 [Geodermatophilus bullaregiensis]|uniref:DUF349 domain-containing protein n=1 Tax=Geodermatophilus bullaregiensis TaxID=1564160 RepID=UPI00195DF52F|nr:DUF349 domain-containing protein [Geodermatophilus bullaregiensis]MBM7805382.1 hypothetical protein [Geodermatophilus bullaregiensis]